MAVMLTISRQMNRITPLLVNNTYLELKNNIAHLKFSSKVLKGDTVRIGCSSGFWGDTAVSAPQLIKSGNVDFLVADYLSEVTMSLLTAAKQKMPEMGYAPDFVQVAIGPYLKDIKSKGVRVVSNAGGINPKACAAALRDAAKKSDVDLKVASVTGDDIMSLKGDLVNAGIVDMFSGSSFPNSMTSMTAYLGAGAIADAFNMGADVVITGRCTDSALVLGPLMHHFKWSAADYDLLASGSLAGHLIECGAQVTGGNFTDWHTVPNWHNIGFPIVECSKDGKFIVTKPPKTGGIVTPATCAEQMLYEIGDPQAYVLPDVVCDFSNVKFTSIPGQENEAVLAEGAIGHPPTPDYKISGTYADGYRLTGVFMVGGPKAAEKGKKTAEAILKRVRGIFKMLKMDDFTRLNVQAIGTEESYGKHATPGDGPREAVIWLAAQHSDKKALQLLSMEIAPAGTGMAPGLTGIAGGRPKVSPVLKLFSFSYPKYKFDIQIEMNDERKAYKPDTESECMPKAPIEDNSQGEQSLDIQYGDHSFRLEDLAYTRSGDKGNNCNIGVVARHPSFVPYLRAALTTEAVENYMPHVFDDGPNNQGKVIRYEVPGVNGFNFVLQNSLGGGGIASVRMDPQGKAYGQMLLDFKIENVPNLVEVLK